ncbi:MAG TPA: hypothetical protein VFW22_14025 [Pseudolabrys sp.]|nr:hypothetical protein [Pseudolabrys sp.]
MSVLLTVVGVILAVLGVAMAGYGVPVKEFSFGNTLILAGSGAVVGGLIIVAIGATVGQLQRIAEMLAARAPLQAGQPAEPFETPTPQRAMPSSPIPFPERPKSPAAAFPDAPPPLAPPIAMNQPAAAAPMLRNPDAPASLVEQFEIPEHDDVSLSPPSPVPAVSSENGPLPPPAAARPERTIPSPPSHEHRPEPPPAFVDEGWPSTPAPPPPPRVERQTQTSYFDTMWPADSRTPKRPAIEESQLGSEPEPMAVVAPGAPSEPVAILKSGVVDGMAYTLYVDGSIEAELPHGTLRFASINELRDHLAKGS